MQLDVRSRLARAARNSLKMRNFTIRIGTQRGSQMANCLILFTERSPEWSKMRSLSFLDSLLAIRKRSIRWLILPLHCFLSGEWSRNLAVTALICGSCMPGFEKYVASMFGRMTMASRSNRRRGDLNSDDWEAIAEDVKEHFSEDGDDEYLEIALLDEQLHWPTFQEFRSAKAHLLDWYSRTKANTQSRAQDT